MGENGGNFGNQTDVANHLDLTQQRVSYLIKTGILPPTKGRGGYDIDGCRIAYIRYLRGLAGGQVKPATDDETGGDDYSRLLEKEKYRKEKRENDIAEKLVAPIGLLSTALEAAGNQIIPILESLPLNMKRSFPELTGDEIDLVKREIAKCRNIIADLKIEIED